MSQREVVVWFLRHAETIWNQEHRLAGWSDVPLTPRGKAQAQALREVLEHEPFDGVWSSDLSRAIDTVSAASGRAPTPDARLREIFFGALEGASWLDLDEEHRARLSAYDGFRAPDGESLQEAAARLEAFLAELAPGRHLVCAHGGVLRHVTRMFGEDQFLPNCGLVGVKWRPERAHLFTRLPPKEPR
jgi:probable phosphoglycerate mutase